MNNLYRVTTEFDIDEILSDNSLTLTTICYVNKGYNGLSVIKSLMTQLAHSFPQFFFCVVYVDDYTVTDNKYTKNLKQLPKIIIYFNGQDIAVPQEIDKVQISKLLMYLNNKIQEKIKPIENKEQSELTEVQKKIQHIQQLYTTENLQSLKNSHEEVQ